MRETQQVAESFGWLWQPPQFAFTSLEYWQSWYGWGVTNLVPILLLVVILLLLTELFVSRKREKEPSGWRGFMTALRGRLALSAKQRKEYLDMFQEDGIVEFVETGVYEGKITREEANALYAHFVDYCGLKGLQPRTDQAKLKALLEAKHNTPKAQTSIGSTFIKALKKQPTA